MLFLVLLLFLLPCFFFHFDYVSSLLFLGCPQIPPSSATHPPSKDIYIFKPFLTCFASSCGAWTFWWFGNLVVLLLLPLLLPPVITLFTPIPPITIINSSSAHPSPPSSTLTQGNERQQNLFLPSSYFSFRFIFDLFLALCRQPHSVSRKLCVKE